MKRSLGLVAVLLVAALAVWLLRPAEAPSALTPGAAPPAGDAQDPSGPEPAVPPAPSSGPTAGPAAQDPDAGDPDPQAEPVELEGFVVDSEHTLLPGVRVTLPGLNGQPVRTTDDGGWFAFEGLPPGRRRVRAVLPGYPAWEGSHDPADGELWITLQPGPTLDVTVRSADGSAMEFSAAGCTARHERGHEVAPFSCPLDQPPKPGPVLRFTVRVDRRRLAGSTAGRICVRLRDGRVAASDWLDLTADDRQAVAITVAAGRALLVRVIDHHDAPVVDAKIRLRPADGAAQPAEAGLHTDAFVDTAWQAVDVKGTRRLRIPATGTWTVETDGGKYPHRRAAAPDGPELVLKVGARPAPDAVTRTLELEVIGADGKPVAGAQIEILTSTPDYRRSRVTGETDAEGRVRIADDEDLIPGRWRFEARSDLTLLGLGEVVITEDPLTRARVWLDPQSVVELRGVVQRDGVPQSEAWVQADAWGVDIATSRDETDAQGRFRLQVAPAKAWVVYFDGHTRVVLAGDRHRPLVLDPDTSTSLQFRVRTEAGDPQLVRRATLWFETLVEGKPQAVAVDTWMADFRKSHPSDLLRFTGNPAGRYWLTGATTYTDRKESRSWRAGPFEASGRAHEFDAVIPGPAHVRGRVLDAAGVPLSGVDVWAEDPFSGERLRDWDTTGPDGAYELLGVWPGHIRLRATAGDHVDLTLDVQTQPGKWLTQDLVVR